MASLQRYRWEPVAREGAPRSARRPCEYEAYLPDPLLDREFQLSGTTAADIADAEAAVLRLNREGQALTNSEALARILLRTEAVASSRIEGMRISGRRLLRAETARNQGVTVDVTAEEILANIRAMAEAVGSADRREISVDWLCDIHRELVRGTRMEGHGGQVRVEQNWIGGNSYTPCGAAFVPPPPETVLSLLEDLCAFCNADSLPAVAQAAIAHLQFETIHPFIDGNGRTGRALIHAILRRRGIASRFVPPISLVLANQPREYIERLGDARYTGDAESEAAIEGLNRWLSFFAAATTRSVREALQFEEDVRALQGAWRTRLGRVRAGSSLDLLIEALPAAPVLTVGSAAELIGRTFQATNLAVEQLVEAGILRAINVGRRNRAFEVTELVNQFAEFERALDSPNP